MFGKAYIHRNIILEGTERPRTWPAFTKYTPAHCKFTLDSSFIAFAAIKAAGQTANATAVIVLIQLERIWALELRANGTAC